jgi:Domain of unknown function (DUF1906)
MPGFAGFDTDVFPGVPEMAWLKANTNLVWCGYYLAPAPSHGDASWMGQRAGLQAAGWGIAPVYVGQQIVGPGSHDVSGQQGTIDGEDAVQLLTDEGFAAGTAVYLDLENGAPFAEPQSDYVVAWVAAVQAGGYQPGVYCSHGFAVDVHTACPTARVWAFKVDTTQEHPFPGINFPDLHPAGSGYAGAYMWQLGQSCRLTLPDAPVNSFVVDLDTAVAGDPGAP